MIHKDMEGRYASVLLQGVPVLEIKVKKATDEEVIGEHEAGEEVHIRQSMIIAYWPDGARDLRASKAKERAKMRKRKDKENTN